jgi:hypothetical protein
MSDEEPDEDQMTFDSPYIVNRFTMYVTANCPQNLPFVQPLLREYGTDRLGELWMKLFRRYGEAEWNCDSAKDYEPKDDVVQLDPFDKVRSAAREVNEAPAAKMTGKDLKSSIGGAGCTCCARPRLILPPSAAIVRLTNSHWLVSLFARSVNILPHRTTG